MKVVVLGADSIRRRDITKCVAAGERDVVCDSDLDVDAAFASTPAHPHLSQAGRSLAKGTL